MQNVVSGDGFVTSEPDEAGCADIVPAGNCCRQVGKAISAFLFWKEKALIYKDNELRKITAFQSSVL